MQSEASLQENIDDQNKINEHFRNSIFDDVDDINQTSCTGLILMHINILGGREDSSTNETEQENNMFTPPYDELIAFDICQILLKRGASQGCHLMKSKKRKTDLKKRKIAERKTEKAEAYIVADL
ncbi:unnamed protein product [Rotaria magnacalcarata]|uniref:Uncharacterized protein n=1 Tax=Rotaria magnacalcarata TaxID=392030 RepID=A0A816FNZ7_9BILA|nr:unnamed protein product [Rotaria magnacalcarata]CAF5185660.1 unnamed protein product [Rotaria magnacalcarata]